MKLKKIILFTVILSLITTLFSAQEPDQKPYNRKLIVAAWKMASRISPNPIKLYYVFDKQYLKKNSKQIVEKFKELYNQYQEVVDVSSVTFHSNYTADFLFYTKSGYIIPVTITVNRKGRIVNYELRPAFKEPEKIDDTFKTAFEKLNYTQTSVILKRTGLIEDDIYSKDVNITYRTLNLSLPLLLELVKNDINLNRTVKLEKEQKIIPCPELYNYPDKTVVSLFTLVNLMLKENDLNAQDILFDTVGRENLEELLEKQAITDLKLNMPLLKVSEMYKIEGNSDLFKEYHNIKTVKEKRKFLKKLGKYSIITKKINQLGYYLSVSDFHKFTSTLIKNEYRKAQDLLKIRNPLNINKELFNDILYTYDLTDNTFIFSSYIVNKTGKKFLFTFSIYNEKGITKKEVQETLSNLLEYIIKENFI